MHGAKAGCAISNRSKTVKQKSNRLAWEGDSNHTNRGKLDKLTVAVGPVAFDYRR